MALTSVVIDSVATTSNSVGATQLQAPSARRVDTFVESLRWQYAQAGAATDPNAAVAAPAAAVPPATDVGPAPIDPNERTRRGLELDGPGRTNGDMILDGLQKLRQTFDHGQSRVSEILESGQALDLTTMLKLQVEIVNYTMLIDITSKMTGKSTQAFDTLMKGQ